MKYTLFVIFCFACMISNKLDSQIPNAGFELWESIDNYEKPLNWETNQDTNHTRFMKSEDSVEGDYSIKIIDSSQTAWTNCNNLARTGVKLTTPIGEKKALSFYVKSVLDSFNQSGYVFISIQIYTFESDNYIERLDWMNYDVIEEFTKQEIPILNPNVDSLDIKIIGGAANGAADGCHDRNTTWIDAFKIDTLLSLSILNESPILDVSIYPNPSHGTIHIQSKVDLFNRYELISIQGKIVERGAFARSSIKTDRKGMFFLRLSNSGDPQHQYNGKVVLID